MSERKKSWAEMTDRNSEWFTWPDILEMTGGKQEVTLQVVKAEQGKIKQSNKRVVALTFDGAKKPLGLNATNAKSITSLYGTDKPADWADQRILLTLFVGQARDPESGGQCNCVRIRAKKPSVSQLHGAKYDHDAALALIASATSQAEIDAHRVTIAAQKPPAAHHAALKDAFAAREAEIKEEATAAEHFADAEAAS